MVRLRLGLYEVDIADRFGVHPSTVSRIVITWLNLMFSKFQQLPAWLSRHKINRLMPLCFKKWYQTTRVIDCTEFLSTPFLPGQAECYLVLIQRTQRCEMSDRHRTPWTCDVCVSSF